MKSVIWVPKGTRKELHLCRWTGATSLCAEKELKGRRNFLCYLTRKAKWEDPAKG
jgi:hypothetical protein